MVSLTLTESDKNTQLYSAAVQI